MSGAAVRATTRRTPLPLVLYWAAAAALAAFVFLRPFPVAVPPDLAADPGEQLLHPEMSRGLSAWSMPGASVLAAVIQSDLSRPAGALALQLPVLLCALLAFSLGCELESLLAGLAAAALALVVMARASPLNLDQLLLSDGVLLTAALLAAPSERANWKDAAVGGAIAASLLVRGVLALLPPLLALSAAFFRPRESARRVLRRAVLFSLLPALVILAWGLVQRGANGRFAFLEWSGPRADSNLITGALGLVGTVEGDAYGLAGVSRRGGVLAWAAEEALRHPARFAFAFARRIGRVASLSPLLFLLGLAGAWRCGRRKETAPVAALAAYFLLFHCSMTVEPRYFLPLALLACPLAASCLGALPVLRAGGSAASRAPLAWACFVPAAAAAACVLGLLVRYPLSARSEEGLARALHNSPQDPDLWLELGRREIENGRPTPAEAAYKASYRLSDRDEARFGSLLAAFMRGANDPALAGLRSDAAETSYLVSMLKTFVRLEQGRDEEARAAFARGKALWISKKSFVRNPYGPYEEEQQERLRDDDTALINLCFNTVFFALPKARRLALAPRLPRLRIDPLESYDRLIARFPSNAVYRHDRGVVNVMLGRWDAATTDLKAAIALDPDFQEAYLTLASACVERGDLAGAAAADRALLARPGLSDSRRGDLRRELSLLEPRAVSAP